MQVPPADFLKPTLAALKSFFRYVQAQAPEQIAQARQVLDVKAGQAPQPTIGYLPVEAIGLLLEHATRRRPRDLALLTTLYDTGARVQEVCDLSIGDLHLDKPASAALTGKGCKTRIVPLTPQAAQILTQHVRTLPHDSSAPVFANRAGQRLGRASVAHTLARCMHATHAERPELVPEKISPHVLRHSKAIRLLENRVNLIHIRDILGHASIVKWFASELAIEIAPFFNRILRGFRGLEPGGRDDGERQAAQAPAA
ncbi:MAG: tyrosine-type recombinase/integrase, partial [Solirubrobacteraceae bacterium]